MSYYILSIIYAFIIIIACIARYRNICKCNDDKKRITDIIQILIFCIGLYYIIGINNIFKIIILLIISIIIRNILEFIFLRNKKINNDESKGDGCDDCNPYKTTQDN